MQHRVPHPVPGKRNDILLEMFQRAADCLLEEPPVFQEALRQSLKEGLSFPKARMQALQKTLASFPAASAAEVLSSPNNILGLEYVKALKACKSSITPCIIPRSGSGYHDTGLSPDQFASATGHPRRHCQTVAHGTVENRGARCCSFYIKRERGQKLSRGGKRFFRPAALPAVDAAARRQVQPFPGTTA